MPPDKDPDSASHPFEGFDVPRQNWFKMPNSWTDITAGISTLAELKVIEYVLKHTWGYQEYGLKKLITTDEFMNGRRRKDGTRIDKGTGLSKPSVVSGLKSAVKHGFLEEEVDATDKARVKKYYSLKMLPDAEETANKLEENTEDSDSDEDESEGVKHLNADVKTFNTGVKIFNIGGKDSLHRSEKDTLERQQQQDTNSNTTRADEEELGRNPNHVVVALYSHGVSKRVAEKLARAYPEDFIAEKLGYLDFLLAERPDEVKRPAAWLRKAIEDDYAAPDGFVSVEERERQANEEERRKQADLEALRAQQEYIAGQAKSRDEKRAARQAELHERYGTEPADEQFWQAVLQELRFGVGLANYALIADAEILRVTDDAVLVGVTSKAKYQDLQHPGQQKQIQRALKVVSGRELAIEVILVNSDEQS
jgi:hypothetical protein